MKKLIFLGLIICLAFYFFKRQFGKIGKQKSDTASNHNAERSKETEDMVQCATCEVHLPRSEAFLVADNFYCCQAHIQNK